MNTAGKKWLTLVFAALIAAAIGATWWKLRPPPLAPGLAMANGRIEATQVDIATKLAGRIKTVSVAEGDLVALGLVVARMDTSTLEAELRQAQAQFAQARHAIATAEAVVAQREAELHFAQNTFKRSEELVSRNFISAQKLDADRMQLLSANAAIVAAQSRVIEAQSATQAAAASIDRIKSELNDSVLKAPRAGRIQYKLAESGEVLPAGGKVVSMLDLSDVYMTVFLPETTAGKLAIGAEARLILDAAPQYVIPARVAFVAAEAQFTPKTVETAAERQKLVFRVKAQIDPDLLLKYQTRVKAGLPGVAYVRVDANAPWPPALELRLPPQ
jgi:HlyD family secretion protein